MTYYYNDLPSRMSGRPDTVETKAPARTVWDIPAFLLCAGLLALPFQVVQVSIAQPGHLWMLATLGFMLLYRSVRFSTAEALVFALFLGVTVILTFLQDYPRVKSVEQLSKFAFFYPGFYLVGRWLGWRFENRLIPLGYVFLFSFLLFQYLTQALSLPVIYQEINFGQGALHGTFRERNWLAVYFLLFSYILLLKDESRWKFAWFFLLNGLVMLLSGSKTTFVAAGIIFLFQSRLPLWMKLVPMAVGAVFYLSVFSDEFSEEKLNVKLEEERGLAFQASIELIEKNPVGYGLGFVEAYFGSNSLEIRGLGEGTNSVFSVPLDLMIVAGFAGIALWLMIFVGVGNSAVLALAPIAALSLLNPLHQSELVYFFIGFIVTLARMKACKPGMTSVHRP
ncbi:hypothetical protein [Ciceribacter sp. L1K22]|uniref:hypothetical protein n=1 Tax=Ciceribacter sp. L1K22 TaxID=2820275 RepID=UPI001ABE8266|nr:hypothetical protein [Ciceribacter sp. L1K22]MBO3762226.1 hypothetical protein [Ciceribacter sp. L1K22]